MANVLDYVENELLVCLCEALAEAGRPVCACQQYAGDERPPSDRCGLDTARERNGQAWVRRGPSSFQSELDSITFGGVACAAGSWRTEIELGIYRCISAIPDRDGNAPPVEAYDADRELIVADRAVLAEVLCCWPLAGAPPQGLEFDPSVSVLASSVESIDPSGACAGSMITITVLSPLTAEPVEPAPTEDVQMFMSRPAGA